MMAFDGKISSADDFREIQSMDDDLKLKSLDPKKRLMEMTFKAQKITDKLSEDKKKEWSDLLKNISVVSDEIEGVWGDYEQNEIIDRVDAKINKFILEYVAEKVRLREEQRAEFEVKNNLLNESIGLMSRFTVLDEETRLRLFKPLKTPGLNDDLVKFNVLLDQTFKRVVDEVIEFDDFFKIYSLDSKIVKYSNESLDGFNDLLADRLDIKRKSLDQIGIGKVLVRRILDLKNPAEYRELVQTELDTFRKLFTRKTPNGFVVKFDSLEKYKDELPSEFMDRLFNFSKLVRLQDLIENYEMDALINGGKVVNAGREVIVKTFDEEADTLFGRSTEALENEDLERVKIMNDSIVEFNFTSLEDEFGLNDILEGLKKEFSLEDNYEDIENRVLDLKFNREVLEMNMNEKALVLLNDRITEGEALLEWKKYSDPNGYDAFMNLSDLEDVDGWVENLSAFADVSFLEKLKDDFSDLEFSDDGDRETQLMALSVKVVAYKLNRLQSKVDVMPLNSPLKNKIFDKLQNESRRFVDISLNIGDENEDIGALNSEEGLKRLTDYMVGLGDFDKAFTYFVEKSALIDENNFQSQNLRNVYQKFNQRCVFILNSYLSNERELLVAVKSPSVKDYNQYLNRVNELAKFITGRGESIDMELESSASALAIIMEGLDLPKKMINQSWEDPDNVLLKDYDKYKDDLEKSLNSLSKEKRSQIDQQCNGKFDELIARVMDSPKNVEAFPEKYITLRILNDALKGYPVDLGRYNVFMNTGIKDYKKLCLRNTQRALLNSGSIEEFVGSFKTKFSPNELKLIDTLADIQGYGWLDISDKTINNTVFVTKFMALAGATLGAAVLSSPFTGGASLLVGATSVAAIATTASHVLYGKGYDTTEDALIGIGSEAGVNFFGAYGGGMLGNALKVSALQKSTGLARDVVQKGLLTNDEALKVGILTNGERALYFSGQMVGDVSLNATLDIAVAKMTKKEVRIFKEFETSVSNPANWAVRVGGIAAVAIAGRGKFSGVLNIPGRGISFSKLNVSEKKVLVNLFEKSQGKIDGKILRHVSVLIEKGKIEVK